MKNKVKLAYYTDKLFREIERFPQIKKVWSYVMFVGFAIIVNLVVFNMLPATIQSWNFWALIGVFAVLSCVWMLLLAIALKGLIALSDDYLQDDRTDRDFKQLYALYYQSKVQGMPKNQQELLREAFDLYDV